MKLFEKLERIENILKESEKRLCILVNFMFVFVIFKDYEGCWFEVNDYVFFCFNFYYVFYYGKKDSEFI